MPIDPDTARLQAALSRMGNVQSEDDLRRFRLDLDRLQRLSDEEIAELLADIDNAPDESKEPI